MFSWWQNFALDLSFGEIIPERDEEGVEGVRERFSV
jgi:hypothetical protein